MQNIIRDIHIKSIRKGHLHLEMYTERKIFKLFLFIQFSKIFFCSMFSNRLNKSESYNINDCEYQIFWLMQKVTNLTTCLL